MSIFGAEVIGTAILILLGDGVVAGTLLARSKAENPGWIVISFGWGIGVAMPVFCTAPAIRNTVANIITEVIATFLLVFGILGILADQATADTGLVALLVGLLVFGIGMSLGGPTRYAINPARDLAPRMAHALLPIPGKGPSDWSCGAHCRRHSVGGGVRRLLPGLSRR